MPMKTRKIKTSLTNKGFYEEIRDHRYFYYKTTDGKQTVIRTKFSHGKNEYNDNLISFVAKQLKLSKEQFVNLINCPLSRNDYEEILREKGFI